MWRKSSYCVSGDCVEVADWFKSSYSADTANCVEARRLPDGMLVRDSKRPDRGVIAVVRDEWMQFIDGVKAGEFDA